MSEAASLARWWHEMGVDTLIDEQPVPWLDRGTSPGRRPGPDGRLGSLQPPASPGAPPAATALPSTLIGLQQWLATDPAVPLAPPPADRLPCSGVDGAALMIIADMPLPGDVEAGMLLSGEVGALYEKMLAAIGWRRDNSYIATLCPGRTPSGAIDQAAGQRLGEIARHHIALAAPRQVWLLGEAVSRAVLKMEMMDARGILQEINHDGQKFEAVVSFSPAFLFKRPKSKGEAWKDMQLLAKGDSA